MRFNVLPPRYSLAFILLAITLSANLGFGQEPLAPQDSGELRRPGELTATVYDQVPRETFETIVKSLVPEAKVAQRLSDAQTYLVEVPDNRVFELVARLRSHPAVISACPNWLIQLNIDLNDPALQEPDQSWGLRAIEAPKAWEITQGGAKVSIVDSGVWLSHEDLNANIVNSYSLTTQSPEMRTGEVDVLIQLPNNQQRIITQKMTGHGTHVAGTVGAIGDNGKGTVGGMNSATTTGKRALRVFLSTTRARSGDGCP